MLLLRSLLQLAPPIFARQPDSQVSSSHQGQPARNWRVWPNLPAGVRFTIGISIQKEFGVTPWGRKAADFRPGGRARTGGAVEDFVGGLFRGPGGGPE